MPSLFDHLDDDVLTALVMCLVGDGCRPLLRLCQVNTTLHGRLQAERRRAERGRALEYQPLLTHAKTGSASTILLSAGGMRIAARAGHFDGVYVAGGLLPTEGCYSWRVQINNCDRSKGFVRMGVCDEACSVAWSFKPYTGMVSTTTLSTVHTLCGKRIWYVGQGRSEMPAGLPYSGQLRLVRDSAGGPSDLEDRANGAIVEITVDATCGSLSFALIRDDGVRTRPATLEGFPAALRLRPWAYLNYSGDQLTTSPVPGAVWI